jgi:acyl-homoserine lactone acylase PvdQ
VVVDFAGDRPTAYGIYPGGQSGDPLDPRLYDLHLHDYVAFEHYRLRTPATPDALDAAHTMARLRLRPAE